MLLQVKREPPTNNYHSKKAPCGAKRFTWSGAVNRWKQEKKVTWLKARCLEFCNTSATTLAPLLGAIPSALSEKPSKLPSKKLRTTKTEAPVSITVDHNRYHNVTGSYATALGKLFAKQFVKTRFSRFAPRTTDDLKQCDLTSTGNVQALLGKSCADQKSAYTKSLIRYQSMPRASKGERNISPPGKWR